MREPILLVLAIFCSLWAGCRSPAAPNDSVADEDPQSKFENIGPGGDVEFVGSEACAGCHEEEYHGYQSHGMANSVYALNDSTAEAEYPSRSFYDSRRDFHYRVYRDGGEFYQEEYRLNEAGEKTHRLVREMEYVIGSGSAAHTYLTENNDRFYELPLTWYTQEDRWDFSPGYRANNSRFNRLIPDRCMACHNAYPESVPFATGKYTTMPEGIGCERCHGPGELHIDERAESTEAPDSIDYTIVNPAHLSLDRRMDVCQQCHLNGTVSLLRKGRGPFDFRPGEPVSAHVSIFSRPEPDTSAREIAVISHAERLKESACFIGSRESERPMECMTCHDAHEGFRSAGPQYFNETCQNCHSGASFRSRFAASGIRRAHEASANCISCHMPRVEAEDAPHASFTDHRIRVMNGSGAAAANSSTRESPADDTSPSAESEGTGILQLNAYFPTDTSGAEGQMYRGMAYTVYGTRSSGNDALRQGARILERALDSGEAYGEAYYQLGLAYRKLGRLHEAIPALERAAELGPGIPERLNALAQAYEVDGRDSGAIGQLYRRALEIQPSAARIRVNYGRFLETEGQLDRARVQYEKVVDEQEWLAIGHYNLGTALVREGAGDRAEKELLRAIELRPDYPEALTNLGALYAQQKELERAEEYMERAVAVAPAHPDALNNLGVFYVVHEQPGEAIPILERALEAGRQTADVLANLGLANFRIQEYETARTYARRALEQNSSHTLARQILQATAP